MRFVSTRGGSPAVGFSEAVEKGLAPDGGLYVPQEFPNLDWKNLPATEDLPGFAASVLAPFLEGDRLEKCLPAICKGALDFPIPLRELKNDTAVLELFHGPTAAFKDVGARFLAECASRGARHAEAGPATVIVATSGDTGGAVAGAFHGRPGFEVMVLYPQGKISARQEKQISCWGGNVHAFAVRGTFDDCQKIVKGALADKDWRSSRTFISANSISLARLLPQMVYYARASAEYMRKHGRVPGFIVPSGNLGNSVAALWAKRIGFPIGQVLLATNANRSISDFFESGDWKPQPTVATLANAMDVGDPSNMERLRHLYPDFTELKRDVQTLSVPDREITEAIRRGPAEWGEVWCPHTATAVVARERIPRGDWILVATAHPAKFETIVEPLIGKTIPVPPALAALLDREPVSTPIAPSLEAFKAALA